MEKMERTTPEAERLSAETLHKYIQEISCWNLHAYMIARGGKVVAEGAIAPHRLEDPHTIYSLSKTIHVLAVGLMLDQYPVSLEDRVLKFFPEYEQKCTNDQIRSCTIRNLLTMNAGLPCKNSDHDFYEASDWVEEFFTTQPLHAPGTYFEYDNRCAYMLSAIVTRVCGVSSGELLQKQVFGPMGITDVVWETDRHNVSQAGWGICTSLETITKLGQLFLNGGSWEGRQLVPADWVKQCLRVETDTARLADPSKQYGYGYQIWKAAPDGVWCGRGAFGQLSILCQRQGLVISTFCGRQSYDEILNATWKLLAAIDSGERAEKIANRVWRAEPNALSLESAELRLGDRDELKLTVGGKALTLLAGHGEWVRSALPLTEYAIMSTVFYRDVACRSHWDGDRYCLELAFLETPYTDTLTLAPDGGKLRGTYTCYPAIRLRGKGCALEFA
jgi:CubicO group peptidase (beta-lactamase class C family)